jgi:hypothetical protein
MTVAYFCPFCSSETLVAVDVWPLKNVSQFVLTRVTAPAVPVVEVPVAGGEEVVDEDEADDVVDEEGAEFEPVPAEELDPLPQAATATPRTRPTAIAKAREVNRSNRIASPCLGWMSY